VYFPFDLHSAAVLDSHMPCRAHAMPHQCRSERNFSRPRYSAGWAWYGICELALAVQGRHVGDLPALVVIRSIPIRQTVGLVVRVFPATARTFTKDTALSQNGRRTARHV
jgi:hypothetical protein